MYVFYNIFIVDEISEDTYEAPRPCLKCGIKLECATDMFVHIKTHL